VMGYGMWAVTRPGEDIHLGDVGFLHAERTGVEPFGCPEAAWAFHPEAQGQGYASEAVACALEWADTRFDRTVAMINPANATSISVARRCGLSIFGEATYKAEPVGLWERLRSSS